MRRWWLWLACVPWLGVVTVFALVVANAAVTLAPAPGGTTVQHETGGVPYIERDGSGVWSLCVSSKSGEILPAFIAPDPQPAPMPSSSSPPWPGGNL